MPVNYSRPPVNDHHYTLVCSFCGNRQVDDGLALDCSEEHGPALLKTEYADQQFNPCDDEDSIFRYRRWLPVTRIQERIGRTIVYRSKGLANAFGLANLWIAFNGYWPERGASLDTATFKELEAHTVLGRLPERRAVLTVASSGNTGAAFAWACSKGHVPCLLIVPGKGLHRFKFRAPLHPCVSLVAIEDGDYSDAMKLVTDVSRLSPFCAEGGVKNVGRRDGLATVLLSAFEEMKRMPSHYFQAVGSGGGAIAVLEAAKRLRNAIGDITLPRLMLCQNWPFTPIYDAWRANSRSLSTGFAERFREAVRNVYADELANWTPPYEVTGGVYEALTESKGDVLIADNVSVRTAMNMFLELEGIDIEPAAGVAVACLRDSAAQQRIDKESIVLLNVTGGGRRRLDRDYSLIPAEPQLRLSKKSLAYGEAVSRVAALPTALAATES